MSREIQESEEDRQRDLLRHQFPSGRRTAFGLSCVTLGPVSGLMALEPLVAACQECELELFSLSVAEASQTIRIGWRQTT